MIINLVKKVKKKLNYRMKKKVNVLIFFSPFSHLNRLQIFKKIIFIIISTLEKKIMDLFLQLGIWVVHYSCFKYFTANILIGSLVK